MSSLVKSLVRYVPGAPQLDRYLQRRYTGCAHPEFVLRGSFHSPLPDLREVQANAATLFTKEVDVGPSIRLRSEEQVALVRELSRFYSEFDWPEQAAPGWRYHLQNGYFCHGDALVLYGMLRRQRPRRVIEVGSGYSSALMLDVNERFLGSRVHFKFIEPRAERLKSLLRAEDYARVELVEAPVQRVPAAELSALEADDLLFIDSSHVSKLGSDVHHLFFQALPRLKPGVLVHIHDVMWPFEYPQEWIEEGRAWNEVYLVRAFLQYNTAFDILLFNSYLAHGHRLLLAELMPSFLINPGASLWLIKRA